MATDAPSFKGGAGCALSLLLYALAADAQTSADPVKTQKAVAQQEKSAGDLFIEHYRSAGEPRVMLFWNVAFDEATETQREKFESSHRQGGANVDAHAENTLTEVGSYADGHAGMNTWSSSELRSGERPVAEISSAPTLSPVTQSELETAFRQELRYAGLRLLNRSASIRLMHAKRDRTGVDHKLIESDAVQANADLVMEVRLIADAAAPLGVGFKVVMTDVRHAADLMSFYTRAAPNLPATAGHYEAGSTGFVWIPPVTYLPSAPEVGRALAGSVIEQINADAVF